MKLNEKGIAKIEFRHFLLLLLVFSFIWILGEFSFSKLNIESLYQLKPIWTKLVLLLAFHCVFLRGANNFVGNCIKHSILKKKIFRYHGNLFWSVKYTKQVVFSWVWGLNYFLVPKLPSCQFSCLLLFVHNFCTIWPDYTA